MPRVSYSNRYNSFVFRSQSYVRDKWIVFVIRNYTGQRSSSLLLILKFKCQSVRCTKSIWVLLRFSGRSVYTRPSKQYLLFYLLCRNSIPKKRVLYRTLDFWYFCYLKCEFFFFLGISSVTSATTRLKISYYLIFSCVVRR